MKGDEPPNQNKNKNFHNDIKVRVDAHRGSIVEMSIKEADN